MGSMRMVSLAGLGLRWRASAARCVGAGGCEVCAGLEAGTRLEGL